MTKRIETEDNSNDDEAMYPKAKARKRKRADREPINDRMVRDTEPNRQGGDDGKR